MNDIADMAVRVNDFLCGLFAAIGIRLVDFKLEFGRLWENDYARVILADEISPTAAACGTCGPTRSSTRTASAATSAAREAYQEVARRLGLLPEGENMVLDLDQHRQKSSGPRPRFRPLLKRRGDQSASLRAADRRRGWRRRRGAGPTGG
jgi:phosphoribosylaminoimidazole-succinocarboxamide synthase